MGQLLVITLLDWLVGPRPFFSGPAYRSLSLSLGLTRLCGSIASDEAVAFVRVVQLDNLLLLDTLQELVAYLKAN